MEFHDDIAIGRLQFGAYSAAHARHAAQQLRHLLTFDAAAAAAHAHAAAANATGRGGGGDRGPRSPLRRRLARDLAANASAAVRA